MLPDVVRDEMQICVAYLVVVKREEEEEEEEFFCQWLPRVLVVDTKKKIYRLHERRAFDLSRPRALRAPGSEYFLHQSLASTASFSRPSLISFWSSSPERTRERGRREEIQKNNERKTSLERESVFKKHQHDL